MTTLPYHKKEFSVSTTDGGISYMIKQHFLNKPPVMVAQVYGTSKEDIKNKLLHDNFDAGKMAEKIAEMLNKDSNW